MFQGYFPIPSVLSIMNTEGQPGWSECRGPDMVTQWSPASWNPNIDCYYNFQCCTRDGTILQNLLDYLRVDTPHLLQLLLPQNWVRWNSPGELNFPKVDREVPTQGRRCTRLDRIHSSDLPWNIIMNYIS